MAGVGGKTKWRKRLRRHGFLQRSRSKDGRKILKNRRKKKRKRLTVSDTKWKK